MAARVHFFLPDGISMCPASQSPVLLGDYKGAGIHNQENKSSNLSANWETMPLLVCQAPLEARFQSICPLPFPFLKISLKEARER